MGFFSSKQANRPPQATVINADAEAIKGKLTLQMLNKGMLLIEETPMRLVFERQGSEGASFLASMVAGEYMAKPKFRFTFVLVGGAEGVTVAATSEMQHQSGYGHPQTSRTNSPVLSQWLDELKQQFT